MQVVQTIYVIMLDRKTMLDLENIKLYLEQISIKKRKKRIQNSKLLSEQISIKKRKNICQKVKIQFEAVKRSQYTYVCNQTKSQIFNSNYLSHKQDVTNSKFQFLKQVSYIQTFSNYIGILTTFQKILIRNLPKNRFKKYVYKFSGTRHKKISEKHSTHFINKEISNLLKKKRKRKITPIYVQYL
eukprot:TRINITY_DN1708_c0_g1_i3.p3 TRINITY_DN1708_c0_g1~~TRINITY_DN1708_c0_g1_i3.p3  ORF type:complete len:185 (+),score=-9.75 TRINITY_DN1708_c0_g1_i3:470-1024(+)